ncbi:MAG: hypothetical protein F6K28_21785 [Microcoleus sp. SIO2G3]|nr:hypothetical protein [Microcoleus sp. SIO2G3]
MSTTSRFDRLARATALAFRLWVCDRLGMNHYNFMDASEIIWVKRQ